MKLLLVGASFVLFLATALHAQNRAWPTMSEFSAHGRGGQSAASANLSISQSDLLVQSAKRSMNVNCRKQYGDATTDVLLSKLIVKRERIRADQKDAVVAQGGGDWEDSSDDCFGDGHLNFDVWIIDGAGASARLLLHTVAMSYVVLEAQSNGYFDMVTARASGKTHMELTWWRFNGRHYTQSRCATLRFTRSAADTGLAESIDRNSSVSEHSCH